MQPQITKFCPFRSQIHPQKGLLGMNWGRTLFWVNLAQTWIERTIFALNNIEMFNLYVEDNLSAKFISRRIPWGWTGEEPYFSINLAKTWFEWTILALNKIEIPNFYVGDHLCTQFIPKRIPWEWTGEEPYFLVNLAQTCVTELKILNQVKILFFFE